MGTEIRAAVVTVSDRCVRGEQRDESGALLKGLLEELGAVIVASDIVSDDLNPLADKLRTLAGRPDIN
ncbi:molybdopterin-binding protein, partial [Escherichia coli]|nr:molybdopterin-binding protein [Escherichia coli]